MSSSRRPDPRVAQRRMQPQNTINRNPPLAQAVSEVRRSWRDQREELRKARNWGVAMKKLYKSEQVSRAEAQVRHQEELAALHSILHQEALELDRSKQAEACAKREARNAMARVAKLEKANADAYFQLYELERANEEQMEVIASLFAAVFLLALQNAIQAAEIEELKRQYDEREKQHQQELVDVGAAGLLVGAVAGMVVTALGAAAVKGLKRFGWGDGLVYFDHHRKRHYLNDGGLLRFIPDNLISPNNASAVFSPSKHSDFDTVPNIAASPSVPVNFTLMRDPTGRLFVLDFAQSAPDQQPIKAVRLVPDAFAAAFRSEAVQPSPVPMEHAGAPVAPPLGDVAYWAYIPTIVLEVYEYQRWTPWGGWKTPNLPTDRPAFATRDGKRQLSLQQDTQLPPAFVWAPETASWQLERDDHTDNDGWSYALDFPRRFTSHCAKTDCVRRRRWTRPAVRPRGTTN